MPKNKNSNSFEIALSGISCGIAVLFLSLGILSGWLLATGYFIGVLAMMLPLSKDFFKGGACAYAATCILTLILGAAAKFWDIVPFAMFFGIHPLVNALICTACAGLWWFFPVTYAYTDTVFSANTAMLAVNLLPAYPLDGGRAVSCLFSLFLPKKKVKIVLRVLSGIISVSLVLLFTFVLRNITLLIFAVFLLVSAFTREGVLSRIDYTSKKIKRGREIKHVMLNKDSTYKDALRYVNEGKYCIFDFFSDGMLDEICEEELFEMLQNHSIYDKISE